MDTQQKLLERVEFHCRNRRVDLRHAQFVARCYITATKGLFFAVWVLAKAIIYLIWSKEAELANVFMDVSNYLSRNPEMFKAVRNSGKPNF